MEAYRPTPYAQTKVAVRYYTLTTKGQSYLKTYHPVWNGDLEADYRSAAEAMGIKPLFQTPQINAIAPQSFYFEHDIATLSCVIRMCEDSNGECYIFGKALIKAKINHVLGLPTPEHRDAWQYDAIISYLPCDDSEIILNLSYYRPNRIEPLEKGRNRAIIIEYERSKKKEKELDNFVVKIAALAKYDASPLIISSSKALIDQLKKEISNRLEAGFVKKWEKRTHFTENGRKTVWASKSIKLDKDQQIHFRLVPSTIINEIAGFAFRKK